MQTEKDNKSKASRNRNCDFPELKPYDNTAFLEIEKHLNLLIAQAFAIPKRVWDDITHYR